MESATRPSAGNPRSIGTRGGNAAREEAGRDEEHEGDGNLGGDEPVAQRPSPSPGGRARDVALQLGRQVRPRRPQRRREAGDHAGDHRDRNREREHPAIDVQPERQRDWNRQLDSIGQAHQDPGQRGACDRAGCGQHDAFRQQLTHETTAARADRQANPDLLLSPRRAREQHARDVRARNQQDETDHQRQAKCDWPDHSVRRRMHVNARGRQYRHVQFVVRLRIRRDELFHDQAQVRARAFDRFAVFQPALEEHPALAAALEARLPGDGVTLWIPAGSTSSIHAVGVQTSGCSIGTMPVNVGPTTPTIEVRLTVNTQRLGEDRRAAAENPLPRAVRNDHDARRSRRIVFRQERPANRGLDAEHLEVVAGDDLAEREA